LLRKKLELEKSKQISKLPDSEITKTLDEHYQEKLNKLDQENIFLKKRYEEAKKEIQAKESESKTVVTNSATFQVNEIPEWGTLDKNLDQVQSIDKWFQGRFTLEFSSNKSTIH